MFRGRTRLNEKGATLILALLFLLILTALGLAIVMNSQIDNAISKNYSKTIRSTFAAQTGIERIKPYLLYDLERDPARWRNNILWVPAGTPGASPGGTAPCTGVAVTSDCFYLGDPANVPDDQPYDVVDALADAQTNAIWAPENPAGFGTYGYQLMFRNFSSGTGWDSNKICVDAGGYSDSTIGLMGTPSRGSDLVEQCLVGEDISIWNNIIFVEGGATSGMGNFKIHGNVHILGSPKPPISTDINVTVKGNMGWYNDYTSGFPLPPTLAAVLDPAQAARTTLDAKIRDRNGLIDAQNTSAEFGTSAIPYDAVFGCDDCGGVFGFTNFASTLVRAQEMGPYDVPDSVLAKIKVPLLTEQYKDERGVLYPNYEGYLLGVANAGGIAGNNLPGVLGLRMATMNIGNSVPPNWTANFGDPVTTIDEGSIAERLLPNTPAATNERNELFAANVKTTTNPNPVQQDMIDTSVGLDPTTFNAPIPANSGKTFMLVAVDEVNDVVIIYKEVQPFDRNVDKDLGGPGGFSTLHTNRQVHGLIFVPTHPNLNTLSFRVDIDGNNLDGGTNYNSGFTPNFTGANAMKLLRKAVNALWLASQGTCMADSSDPCWNRTEASPDNWINEVPYNLRAGMAPTADFTSTDAPKLVGSGVIQMPDQFTFNSGCSGCPGVLYAGRFSLFTEETGGASNATSSGYVDMTAGPKPVPAYQVPVGTGTWYSFPCDNSMGIMAARRIDMGDPWDTHGQYAGAFYAYELLKVQKQIQILGAIVAQDFDLLGGGNPDWYQAMEMPSCLPPEMIGKEPVVYIRSQSYSDR